MNKNYPEYEIFKSSLNYPCFISSCLSSGNFEAAHILTKAYNEDEAFKFDITEVFENNIGLSLAKTETLSQFLTYKHFLFNEDISRIFINLIYDHQFQTVIAIFQHHKKLIDKNIDVSNILENLDFISNKEIIIEMFNYFNIKNNIKSNNSKLYDKIQQEILKNKAKKF